MSGCYENEIEHDYLPFVVVVAVAAVLVVLFAALVAFFAAAESVFVFVIAAVVMAEKMCLQAEGDDF